MCRTKAVGTAVAEQPGTETDTLLPYVGVVTSTESWGTAYFALQLISLLLILLSLGAASYFAYKRRQELRKSYQDFATQTDREVGTREDLDRVIKSVSSLQHQVLTMELERESERRLAQLRRSRSVSQEYLHGNDADGAADLNIVLSQ